MLLHFSFLIGICFLSGISYALTVKNAVIDTSSGTPSLSFSFDETFVPEPDQEDEETLLIEFPEDTKWEPSLSKDSKLGLRYTYIPYQDGSGDLVIKKNKHLVMGELVQHNTNQYTLPFSSQPGASTPQRRAEIPLPTPTQSLLEKRISSEVPLAIKGLRLGRKKENTRFVLDLNRQSKFIIKENDDFSKIYIIPTEVTEWIPSPSSSQSFGSFKGYKLVKIGKDIGIEVSVEKGTRIVSATLLEEHTPQPKLVIDLGHRSFVPLMHKEISSKKIEALHSMMKTKNNDLLSQKNSLFPEKELIKSMNILVQNNDTIIRLETTEPKNFDVRNNTETNDLTIFLPKVMWEKVNVTEKEAGLVNRFRVDQSDPNHTKLIFKLQKETSVIGKKVFGKKGNGRFVVYLNQKEKKTPTWLISASDSKLSYDDLEKEEGETSRLVYRGGIRSYTNIGTGFYVGANASSVSGQSSSNTHHLTKETNLSNSNFGAGGHVFAGYGINFQKIYTGAELNIGIYGADDKTTYDIATTERNSSSKIRHSWDISGRLGYYVAPTTLLYSRLGFLSTNFSYDGSSTSDGGIVFPATYRRSSRTGFLFGAGLESALNDHISVRIEGAQINYQPIKHRSGTSYKKDRFLINEVSFGAGYKLSPMAGPAMGDIYEESVGTGFYFGADGGLSTLTNHRKVNGTTDGTLQTKYDGQGSTLDPSWGLFSGYSYHLDKFFLAGEFQLSLTKPIIEESISQNGITTESYSNRLRWLWALTARPGYVFNHGTIGYGRIGFCGGSLSHSSQHSGAQRGFTVGGAEKSYALGMRLGAGIETFINRHLTLRGDYTLDYMPGIKIKDDNNNAWKENITLINNEFKLGLSWYIDP